MSADTKSYIVVEKGNGTKNSVVMNLEFTNKNLAANVLELFLFYRLRIFAAKSAGWVKGFEFTKNERYNVLPNLIKLGWVSEDGTKVVKYRDLLKENKIESTVSADISAYELCDINTFKGFLLAINEKYLLDNKNRINEEIKRCAEKRRPIPQSWGLLKGATRAEMATLKTKEDCVTTIQGRAFIDELCRLMGLGSATITRWRAKSKDNGFNTYELRNIRVNKNHLDRTTKLIVEGRKARGSVYTARENKVAVFTKDLLITSGIELFKVSGKKKSIKRKERVAKIIGMEKQNNIIYV